MRDLSSPTRGKPVAPALEVQSLNHWTIREVPQQFLTMLPTWFPELKLSLQPY